MATYTELFDLGSNDVLRNKIAVAIAIKAQTLLDGVTPTAAEVTWANDAIANPSSKASQFINYVLAANNGLSVAAISGASDAAIQTNVDAAADALIAGGA